MSCLENWEGAKERAALGSVDDGSSVCCPAEPTVSGSNTRSYLNLMDLIHNRVVQMIRARRIPIKMVYREFLKYKQCHEYS